MSRVGKNPVVIPQGVTVDLKGQDLKVKGKRGELSLVVHDDVEVTRGDAGLSFKPRSESRRARMQWGTARARADAKNLKLQLGFSHDVEVPIPTGIQIKALKPTEIEITGSDRQQVGQLAAEIRSLRPPEPYKGKGIKYSTETVRRKEGKKK
jgi:large subunit ribosomal protein L6